MADKDLTSITVATSIGASDLLYAVIGGNSRKITLANFFTSPTFVTPTLGVAIGTSLAIGGATIGTNALAVTGNSSFAGGLVSHGSAGGSYNDLNFYDNGLTNRACIFGGDGGTGTGGTTWYSSWCLAWVSGTTGDVTGARDTVLSRNAAGIQQFGTNAANSAGGWLATSAGLGASPTVSSSTWFNLSAGTTARSQVRYAASTAPTSPIDGDFWFDGTNVKIQVSGATKTFSLT